MADVLYLVHRLPYPPNKGDKVRSYHLLRHLCRRHRVHLGTFVDDPADLAHVDRLRQMCASLHVARLNPLRARIRSIAGLVSGTALTIPYYADSGLRRWTEAAVASHGIRSAVVFSGAMAQYVPDVPGLGLVLDLVDVDSEKWTQYAARRPWPLSWLFRREGARLLEFERRAAAASMRTLLVTDAEADLFRRRAPECAERVATMGNGVDADFFAPDAARPSPYRDGGRAVVFTGAMDYWPNVDAVTWFAGEVLPQLREKRDDVRFVIVGRSPPPAVRALEGPQVLVTGTVDDVRPFLQHASVVVAPLRVARGIQNKILEAMSMGRPVVASRACCASLDATEGVDYVAAESATDFACQVGALLDDSGRAESIGSAARQRVLARYSWDSSLAAIDASIDRILAGDGDRQAGADS